MAILKRNLWTLFALILLGGVLLLSAVLFFRWQGLISDEKLYQTARVELVSQSVDSILRTQELVLDVIGRELLNQDNLLSGSRQIPLLDSILAANPMLVGFGLARPDGTLVRVSTTLDLSTLPNLRTDPETRDSFLGALSSDAMVVGRTYFVDALGAWVIPIRKAIRSPSGEVVAVMTAGMRLDGRGSVFGKTLHDGDSDTVMLFRETDGYVQFMSADGIGPQQYSQIRVPMDQRETNRAAFEKELGKSVEEVMQGSDSVVIRTRRQGEDYLTAAVFNARYQVWSISETRFAPLYREFLQSLLQYLLTFLVFGIVFYKGFRIIDNAEKKRRLELSYLSRHDDLTGLLNRNGLLDRLDNLVPDRKPFCLIVINIDNFKGINDRFGLETGDETLLEFGRRLAELVESRDDLARLGGDEYAIVTPNTNLDDVEKACVSLAGNLSRTFEVGRLRLQVTASIGVACFPNDGDSLSKLIRSAHLALYEAKQSRNDVCIYRSEMEMAYLRRLSVEQRLRYGLASGSLYMVYQPQVDQTGKAVGLEALVRWQDEELGFVSPAEFVEVAEKSGLMVPLGRFVLETSIREYSLFRNEVGGSVDLSINISVIQFRQPDFVETVLEVLAMHRVSPGELVLEITESLFMSDFERVLKTIERLREKGIRISMDDFGTGYSSLSLLRKLPLDELKIDKSFVDTILEDEKAANMIRSIIAIARSHNMELVAEGVEEEAQASAPVEMGCRRFQGYYFSRPETLDRLKANPALAIGH